jgi:hypothetical protein
MIRGGQNALERILEISPLHPQIVTFGHGVILPANGWLSKGVPCIDW